MKHKQTSWRRLLASILSILLLVNTTGLSAIAESGSNHTVSQKGLINSFEELPASTVEQTVSPGTAVSSLNLPSKVKAEVIWNFEGEDNKTATDSNSTPLASDSNSTQTAIRQQMDVEVDWTEQPAYDAQKEGTYLFTAVPRDFSLNSGVKPPEITVHVSSSAAPLKQTITGFGNLSATEYIVAKGTKESELPLEKTIPVMFNGSSQTSILPVTWVCISDSFGNALYNPDHENDSAVFTFLPKWDESLFVLGSGLTEYDIPTVDIKFNTGINLLNKGLDPLNLVPGETYWFDLSAKQIPGTPNKGDNAGGVMVPDKTFHYIPFTYVGTINAYKKTDTSVSTNANVQAEDETLFLSDYNIVRDVSWKMLNDEGLIFGTPGNYTSGGVFYTLRSPSVGSVPKYSAPYVCDPASNEWDVIYAKDNTYIKNTFHYYTIGQDTYEKTTYDQVVVRGSNRPDTSTVVSRHYQATPADSSNLGFRPVLELEDFDFLAQNGGFHVITLDLKHGYLKNDKKVEKILQIAAASGQDFEAPAGDGFQPPDSGKEFDKWEGDDGNFYASGEIVPYTVNVLSALYKEQSRYNTVYVNGVSGDDANDGQSEANPFKTLDHAFGMVADGGTIVICGNTRVLTNYSTVFVPYVAPPRDVTITSNNNSTLTFDRSMILNGDTTFKNLTIDTGSVRGLFANGFKLVMDEGTTIKYKNPNFHTFVLVGGEVFNNDSERMVLPAGRGSNIQILDGSYGPCAIIAGPSVSRYSAGGSFIDADQNPLPIDTPINAEGDYRLLIGGTTSKVRDIYGGVYADETTAKKVTWHNSEIKINAPNVQITNLVAGSRAQMQNYNHTDGTEIRQADDSSTEIHLLDGAVESILGGSEVLEWTGASADFYENISKVIIDGGRLGSYIAAGGVTCSVSVSQSGGPTSDILNEMIIETSEPLDQNGLLASGMFLDVGLGDTNPYQQLSTNLLEVILKNAGEIGTVDIDPSYSGGASAKMRILTIDGTASATAPKAIPDNFNALRLREGGSAILTADSEFEFLKSEGSQGTLILQEDNSGALPAILLKDKVVTDNSILLRVTDTNGNSVVQTEGTTLLSFPSEDNPDPSQFILDAANGDFDIVKDGKDLVLAKKLKS